MNIISLEIKNFPPREERNIIIVEKADKKELLIEKMKQCSDEYGSIDMKKFRLEYSKEYNVLSHHFGSIEKAIEAAGLVKVAHKYQGDTESMSVKNQLAYAMLKYLYSNNVSIDTISEKYKCTHLTIANLFNALYSASNDKVEKELDYFTKSTTTNYKNGNIPQMEVRDKLAYDYLYKRRTKDKDTLAAIGKDCGCTRAAIDQIYQSLGINKGANRNGKKN